MLRSVSSWLYERDAFTPLRFEAPLAALKARLAAGEPVWSELLKKHLLGNPHRVTLELLPDGALGAATEAAEREKCERKKGSMSPAEARTPLSPHHGDAGACTPPNTHTRQKTSGGPPRHVAGAPLGAPMSPLPSRRWGRPKPQHSRCRGRSVQCSSSVMWFITDRSTRIRPYLRVFRQVEALVKATHELKERQETPDSPEALRCMPSLALADIPRESKRVPTSVSKGAGGATLLRHELPTNGVLYADALFDLQSVPVRLLPLVSLFCRSLTNMGTDTLSFVQLQQRIGATVGGFGVSAFTSDVRGRAEPAAFVTVRGKVMAARAGELFDLTRDVLLRARLDDKTRFKQMVLEAKAGMESRLQSAGHVVASARLGAQMSAAGWCARCGPRRSPVSWVLHVLCPAAAALRHLEAARVRCVRPSARPTCSNRPSDRPQGGRADGRPVLPAVSA